MPVVSWAFGVFGRGAGHSSSKPWGRPARHDLLGCYPAATDIEVGAQMRSSFLELLNNERQAKTWPTTAGRCYRVALAALGKAPHEKLT